mgnify:CR=1 FL=1
MIAAVCGNVSIWKPSPKTPLCSIALQRILGKVLRENGIQEGVFNLVIGTNEEIAETLVNDKRVPLISATGSTEMGRITASSGGLVDGTTLQIPTTGYHTMNESASVFACEAFLRVLCRLSGIGSPV